jgi:hypothetical protein
MFLIMRDLLNNSFSQTTIIFDFIINNNIIGNFFATMASMKKSHYIFYILICYLMMQIYRYSFTIEKQLGVEDLTEKINLI